MVSVFFYFLKANFCTFEMLPLLAIGATYMTRFLLASADVAHVQRVFALAAFFSWNFRADYYSKWKICGEINIKMDNNFEFARHVSFDLKHKSS